MYVVAKPSCRYYCATSHFETLKYLRNPSTGPTDIGMVIATKESLRPGGFYESGQL